MAKRTLWIAALAAVFVLGILVTRYYYARTAVTVEEQSQVLLERVKAVSKLITVEGYFSEVYDYKDYWGYDFSFFRKKALIRVKAKVSVGYDLGNMRIDSDPETRRILISRLPDPQILSIDHDIDYYDITEGTFNSFTVEDYNRLNENAKNFIRQKAEQSDLFMMAEEQGNKIFDLIKFMVEGSGWTVEFLPNAPPSPPPAN